VAYGDAVRGTPRLAHHAGHAARRAVLAPHQPVERAQARRIRPPLLRVLDGDGAARVLPPEGAGSVAAHVAKEGGGGKPEPPQHLEHVEPLAEAHGRAGQRELQATRTRPVSTMLAIESGKSPSQPRRIAWSYRKRGSVQRMSIMKKIMTHTLVQK